jgi:lipopolysaccharide/colanic/teichoic acid biosynthesis glycosyltransferase
MKRLFDLVLASLAFVMLSLPMVCLYVLIYKKLGHPVLFSQIRPGLNGKPFMMVKFRTMTDARGADSELLPDSERLTPFGRFLRASSLDELPELWNVLKGDMSIYLCTQLNKLAGMMCDLALQGGRKSMGAMP